MTNRYLVHMVLVLGGMLLPAHAAFAAENVSILVTVKPDPDSVRAANDGVAGFDVRLENTSDSITIFAPLRAEIASIFGGGSATISGSLTAANADNGEPLAGAFWRFDDLLGGDNALAPGETSQARQLIFNNVRGTFQVRFRVLSGPEP